MITRSWKNIVGVMYSNNTYNGNANIALTSPISGLFDVNGTQHNTLVTRTMSNSSSYYAASTSVGFNQASLFNAFSNNTNLNTAECIDAAQISGGKSKIVFGTGSTPVKYTDYTLESPITEGITAVEYYVAKSYNEDSNTYEAIITATFTSTIDVTISEVGLIKSIYEYSQGNYYNSAAYYYNVLAAREVLDNPIEVKAGETFSVSIKIDL